MIFPLLKDLIINNGIYPGQRFSLQNKIRIFNISLFVMFFINLFYLITGIITQQPFLLDLFFISYIAVIFILFFMIRSGKTLPALHLIMIFGIVFLASIALLIGEKPEIHVYLLFIPVASIVFDSKKYTFYYFILAMATIVGVKLMYPYCKSPYSDSLFARMGALNMLFTGILIYINTIRYSIQLFKNHKRLTEKNKIIEKQNEKIVDSINYAQHIQQSILIEEDEMQKIFPESFIYYQPKDIVSGDFYWLSEIKEDGNNLCVVAVADCTGHGVPGAFLSMIGNMLLNKIVNEKHIFAPASILNELHLDILNTLHRDNKSNTMEDGMDICICTIDWKNKVIQYAGARNPLYIVHEQKGENVKEELEAIQADNQSIGSRVRRAGNTSDQISFTNHTIPFEKEMSIYLFSDGYMDQLNPARKLRFGSKRFKNILMEFAHLPMQKQKENLIKNFKDWSGDNTQLDDILIMGIKI